MRAHALEGREEEQDQSNTKGRRPNLLDRKWFWIFVAKSPHGQRRSRLNAHKRKHVGENHDAGPETSNRGFFTQASGKLNNTRNSEVGIIVATAISFCCTPFTKVRCTEFGKASIQGIPPTGRIQSDKADDDNTRSQQDTLQCIHISHSA